jgi:hypothetical protein
VIVGFRGRRSRPIQFVFGVAPLQGLAGELPSERGLAGNSLARGTARGGQLRASADLRSRHGVPEEVWATSAVQTSGVMRFILAFSEEIPLTALPSYVLECSDKPAPSAQRSLDKQLPFRSPAQTNKKFLHPICEFERVSMPSRLSINPSYICFIFPNMITVIYHQSSSMLYCINFFSNPGNMGGFMRFVVAWTFNI